MSRVLTVQGGARLGSLPDTNGNEPGEKSCCDYQMQSVIGADGGRFPRDDTHSFIHVGEWCK